MVRRGEGEGAWGEMWGQEYIAVPLKLTPGRSSAWEVTGGAWHGSSLQEPHSFHLREPAFTRPHLAYENDAGLSLA